MLKVLIYGCLCLSVFQLKAQTSFALHQNIELSDKTLTKDSVPFNKHFSEKQKLNTLLIGGGALYAGSLATLYNLWYKDFPQSRFHIFNDNNEWLQMDKICHATNSYYMGNLGYNTLLWAGLEKKKSIWYGGFVGSFYLTVIEVLDGFSAGWGFSPGDMAANLSGSLIFTTQQATWGKQNILMKHSFMPSPYAKYRPNLLGTNNLQSILKDYNGITCWLSFNLKTFFEGNSNFPDWICLSIGHSGDGMIGAVSNPNIYDGKVMPKFVRQRQFFLSGDIDLTRLPIKSKYFKAFTKVIGFIKVPFPALEYNKTDKFKFHAVYF